MIENDNMLLEGYDALKDDEVIDIDFKEYYKKKEQIKLIDCEIAKFESYNINLQYSIQNIELDDNLPNISLGDRITSSASSDSYFEKDMIRKIKKLEKLIEENEKKIFQLSNSRNMLNLKISNMSIFINVLDAELKKLIEKRYISNKTLLEISIEENISEGTIRNKIKKIKNSYKDYIQSIY